MDSFGAEEIAKYYAVRRLVPYRGWHEWVKHSPKGSTLPFCTIQSRAARPRSKDLDDADRHTVSARQL